MTNKDMIDSLLESQPEKRELLNIIKVDFPQVETQFHNCEYLQKIISVKFSIDTLKTGGYTLQEILESSDGIILMQAEMFVLERLQKFIQARTPKPETPAEQQNNN